MERPAQLRPRHGVEPAQVVVDDRHQLLPEQFQIGEPEGIHDGQALGQRLVAHLHRRPSREVVAVGGGERPMAEEVAVRVVEDGAGWDLLQTVHQLALVQGMLVERLAQLDTTDEAEGMLGRPQLHSPRTRRATGKLANTRPRLSAPASAATRSPVSGFTNREPASGGTRRDRKSTRLNSSHY